MQGKTIFLNKANMVIEYFSSIGYSWPDQTNPAEYFMETMSIEAYEYDAHHIDELNRKRCEIEDHYSKKLNFFYDQYRNSDLKCDDQSICPKVK